MNPRPPIIRGLCWIGYALVWLIAISLFAIATLALLYSLGPGMWSGSMLWDFWLPSATTCIVVISWVMALRQRLPIRWALIFIFAPVLLLASIGLLFSLQNVFTIVGTIGIIKLFIEIVNRRNVLPGSKLRTGQTIVPPRGLVRYEDHE